jgi:hypothetical protein
MILFRNPDTMTPEEVTSEITSLQDEIRIRGRRIYELAHSLYRRVRRNPVDDSTSVYMIYSNAMTRFAGALEQVSQRTIRTARVLERLPKSSESPEELKKKQVVSSKASSEAVPAPSPVESLISSYINETPEIPNEEN